MNSITTDTDTSITFYQFLLQTQNFPEDNINDLKPYSQNNQTVIDNCIENKLLSQHQVNSLYEYYQNLKYAIYGKYKFDSSHGNLLDRNIAQETNSTILSSNNGVIQVGITNPLDTTAIKKINKAIKKVTEFYLIRTEDLALFHSKIYTYDIEINTLLESLNKEYAPTEKKTGEDAENEADSIIKKFIKTLIKNTAQKHASDIHIEYIFSSSLKIRTRVDGLLSNTLAINKNIGHFLFRTLKIMSELDITQEQSPLDGRLTIPDDDHIINVRISIMPLVNGISAVLRILGRSRNYQDFTRILHSPAIIKTVKSYIQQQTGMMLLVGPTGSGKTTTLYTTLSNINHVEKKIITIEDPVEVVMPGISQIQVQPQFNMDFSDALRSTLRQDPDVILVGEIRDTETATIATRAAITGHMVLATVHADDVSTAIPRLLDLEVDPYFLTSALRLVISQRLIRKLCPFCCEDSDLNQVDLAGLNLTLNENEINQIPKNIRKATACRTCNQTGYIGRIPVFEQLYLSDKALNLLPNQQHGDLIEDLSHSLKGKHLIDNAFKLACKGITSMDEIIKLSDQRQD